MFKLRNYLNDECKDILTTKITINSTTFPDGSLTSIPETTSSKGHLSRPPTRTSSKHEFCQSPILKDSIVQTVSTGSMNEEVRRFEPFQNPFANFCMETSSTSHPILRPPTFTVRTYSQENSPLYTGYGSSFVTPRTTTINTDNDIATYYYNLYQSKKAGFNSIPPNPFSTPTFGKPTGTGFSSASATPFGQSPAPLFCSTTQHASIFGNPQPTFGQPSSSSQTAFGSSMFGTPATQATGNTLFGSPGPSTFGQQNKPGFGFGSTTSNTGFFGQQNNQLQVQQPSTGLFGQSSNNIFGQPQGFGAAANVPLGTVIKFSMVTGTDTMIKGGINQTISTRHHCITFMKEYEGKSLEELRWEDYQANRKGPQQGAQPGTGIFGGLNQPVGGGLFGSSSIATSSTTPLFGQQQENKSVFGSAPSVGAFGQTNTFGTPAASTSNVFGKPLVSGFGTNTQNTSTFTFNPNQQPNPFGASTQNKPFGTPTQPVFGQQPSAFGSNTSFTPFGQNSNQNMSLFSQNKPAMPFSMGSQANSGFGSFGQAQPQTGGSLFNPVKPTQPTFVGFGSTNTCAPIFGPSFGSNTQPLFNSSYKPQTNIFGQGASNTGTVPTMPVGTSNNLFGNNAAKPGNLFGSPSMFNTGFGNNQMNAPFMMPGSQPVQTGNQTTANLSTASEHLSNLSTSPFGMSIHLSGVPEVHTEIKELTLPTNPTELKTLLYNVQTSPTKSPPVRLEPKQLFGKQVPLFEGLEPRDDTISNNFKINNNPKKLNLRPKERHVVEVDDFFDEDASSKMKKFNSQSESQIKSSDIKISDEMLIKSPKRKNNFKSSNNSQEKLSQTSIDSNQLSQEQDEESDEDNFYDTLDTVENAESAATSEPGLSLKKSDNNHQPVTQTTQTSDIEENDNDSVTSESEADVHPTGIILTKPEYYTKPSLDVLTNYISEDGSCMVKGFTVGRLGYGNVRFSDTFDVSGLNLDELVIFRDREITVYPDDSVKPPVGQGLNRKAQVTLDRVWPYQKSEKRIIKDVDELIALDYTEHLRGLCEKQGTRFVDYRPDTGSWVFKVDHFSKFGARESDSDSEEEKVRSEDLKKQQKRTKTHDITKLNDKSKSQSTQSTQFSLTKKSSDVLDVLQNISSFPTPSQAEIEESIDDRECECSVFIPITGASTVKFFCDDTSSKGNKIRRDFFHDLEETDSEMDWETPTPEKRSIGTQTDFDMEWSDVVEETVPQEILPLQTYSSDETQTDEISSVTQIRRPKYTKEFDEIDPKMKVEIVDYSQLLSYDVRLTFNPEKIEVKLHDIMAFKGRAYKPGWGRGMTLITRIKCHEDNDTISNILDFYSSTVEVIKIASVDKFNNNSFVSCLNEQMYFQLRNSDFTKNKDIMPLFTPKIGFQLLESLKNVTNVMIQSSPDISFHMLYTNYIYKLCDALWGKIDDQCIYDYDSDTIRKKRLAHWLKEVVFPYVEYQLERRLYSNELEQIVLYLSGYRLDEAAECAFELDNPRLSMLIAQLPHAEITKKTILQQITMWQDANINKWLNIHIKKIYMLLSGIPAMMCSNDEYINICENMNWIKTLAIYLWYICSLPEKIEKVIDTYEEAVFTYSCAEKPTPLYDLNISDITDLTYHLIKYYCNFSYALEPALNPNTHTYDVLDYSTSWFLIQILKSLKQNPVSSEVQRHICLNFASQLESVNLWHWAVFVVQHIEDENLRNNIIKEIIERNIQILPLADEKYRKKELMLVRDFAIPRSTVDNAKANLALICNLHSEAVHYLTYANRYNKMHEILFDHVLPDHFICYDYKFLERFIKSLYKTGPKLFNWRGTGALMLDVLELLEVYNDILNGQATIDNSCNNIMELITYINARYPSFPRKSYLHDICLYEMSNRIMDIVHYVYKNSTPDIQRQLSRVKYSNITQVCFETIIREMHWKIGNYISTFVPRIKKPNRRFTFT